jgi:hypothetical protein
MMSDAVEKNLVAGSHMIPIRRLTLSFNLRRTCPTSRALVRCLTFDANAVAATKETGETCGRPSSYRLLEALDRECND